MRSWQVLVEQPGSQTRELSLEKPRLQRYTSTTNPPNATRAHRQPKRTLNHHLAVQGGTEPTPTMASTSNLIQLAKSLPTPLQRFFARWPPAAIVPASFAKTPYQEERPNPFIFVKNPATGKWQNPVYSQRRQAQLVQMARDSGVEELLPMTKKGTEYKLAHRVEHGLRVKGTGVGQKVKGHIHERHMIAKYVSFLANYELLLTRASGWRRRDQLCSACRVSSRDGSGYVYLSP